MANNVIISLGIAGILGTGTLAVAVNTSSLVAQDSSTLLDASEVLMPQEGDLPGTPGLQVPDLSTLEMGESPGSSNPSGSTTVTQDPTGTAITPAPVVSRSTPAPVDATSSGSAYYEDDENEDEYEEEEEEEEEDDYEDEDDDDHEDDDD